MNKKHIHTHTVKFSLQATPLPHLLWSSCPSSLRGKYHPILSQKYSYGVEKSGPCNLPSFQKQGRGVLLFSLGCHADVQLYCTHAELEKRWHSPECFIFSGIRGRLPAWNPSHCHNKRSWNNENVSSGFKRSRPSSFSDRSQSLALGKSCSLILILAAMRLKNRKWSDIPLEVTFSEKVQ